MKPFPFVVATLCLGLAACGTKDDFSGTWKGLNTNPGVAMTLTVSRDGDAYRVEQNIVTTVGGGKPLVSHETLSGIANDGSLQIANGLVTLSIDQTTGHLMAPGMANVNEFEKVG